jgi:hypothetical protein
MARPRLTFACELDAARLSALFANGSLLEDLRALDGRVALMLSDFSEARAAVVRQLNAAAIPVIAIPLMPYEDGYYFTLENAPRARARYDEWKAWTAQHSLAWDGVGLDIEPEARVFEQIMDNTWGLVPMLVRRLGRTGQAERARALYSGLIDEMRSDGYRVENYQFPIIADERRGIHAAAAAPRPGGHHDGPGGVDAVHLVHANHRPGDGVDVRNRSAGDRRRDDRRGAGYSRPSPDAGSELGRTGA